MGNANHPESMPTIDVHAHFLPPVYRAALAAAALDTLDGGMPVPGWSADDALAVMDRHGIDRAILSVSSPGLSFCAAAEEPALAIAVNNAAAVLVADYPGRFGCFASLPLGRSDLAVREVARVLDDLQLDGFILPTNYRGHYPSDASWAPVLEALNARGALVLLHPTSPHCLHCSSGSRPAPLIEFPFETTRAVVDMIYTGTLELYPDIRFILPHGGGTLPWLAERIAGFSAHPAMAGDAALNPDAVRTALARLHYDTALAASPMHIEAIRRIAPLENIVFGSDWPFSPDMLIGTAKANLAAMDTLSSEDLAAIMGGNAARLLARY